MRGSTAVAGYKAALSVSVFQTIGSICCMEDTMGLGKFFTSAVTAWRREETNLNERKRRVKGQVLWDFLLPHLKNFHLKTTIRWRSVRHLQSLHKRFCELLHHWKDQCFGCTLQTKRGNTQFKKYPSTREPQIVNLRQTFGRTKSIKCFL